MTAREYLGQVRRLDREISNKLEKLEQWKAIAFGTSGQREGERVLGSGSPQKMEAAVQEMVELDREINALIDLLVEVKGEIDKRLLLLESRKHRRILYLRYVRLWKVAEIAEDMQITEIGCKKAHKRALEKFDKIYKSYRQISTMCI